MGRKVPFTIGIRDFGSKQEAKDHFKDILYKYPFGARIDGRDAEELYALLQLHSESEEKFEGGIDHFSVMVHHEFNTRCFEIVRPDGSSEDFSALHCITPRKK